MKQQYNFSLFRIIKNMHTDYSQGTRERFEQQGSVFQSPTDILTVTCLRVTSCLRTSPVQYLLKSPLVSRLGNLTILILILMLLINLLLLLPMCQYSCEKFQKKHKESQVMPSGRLQESEHRNSHSVGKYRSQRRELPVFTRGQRNGEISHILSKTEAMQLGENQTFLI